MGKTTRPDGSKGPEENTSWVGGGGLGDFSTSPPSGQTKPPKPTTGTTGGGGGTKFLEGVVLVEDFMEQRVSGGGIRFMAEMAVDAVMAEELAPLQREF